jgi:hypothetical protein
MRIYSASDCQHWLQERNRTLPDATNGTPSIRFATQDHRAFAMASWIASHLTFNEPVLLWITEWGIWPSSENWHAYYALRQLSSDKRLLHEAPGHLFLNFEMNEFASILQLALLNGWGGYILPHSNVVNAFFSHDEYMEFFAESERHLVDIKAHFEDRP